MLVDVEDEVTIMDGAIWAFLSELGVTACLRDELMCRFDTLSLLCDACSLVSLSAHKR